MQAPWRQHKVTADLVASERGSPASPPRLTTGNRQPQVRGDHCPLHDGPHERLNEPSTHTGTSFCLAVRTFGISSLSNFQKYNTGLLIPITLLYVTPPGLTDPITGGPYAFL